MNRTAIIIFSLVFSQAWFFQSCQQTEYTAVAYHDSLVVEQVKISKRLNEMNAALETYFKEDMELAFDLLNEQIKKTESKYATMPAFGDDKSFLQASRLMLDEYKKLTENEYKTAKHLLSMPDSAFTDSYEQKVNNILYEIDRKQDQIILDYTKAQAAFAEKHNLAN